MFSAQGGNRDGVPDVIILITDGEANVDKDLLQEETRLVRNYVLLNLDCNTKENN